MDSSLIKSELGSKNAAIVVVPNSRILRKTEKFVWFVLDLNHVIRLPIKRISPYSFTNPSKRAVLLFKSDFSYRRIIETKDTFERRGFYDSNEASFTFVYWLSYAMSCDEEIGFSEYGFMRLI